MARILICDDAVFMRMTIKEALLKAGHDIIGEAESGDEVAQLYQTLKPDLVTMDLLMKSSGTDGIKKIREIDPKAKIVVVSVLDKHGAEVVEAVRAGALGFVTKPIRREVLTSEVNRVLAIA